MLRPAAERTDADTTIADHAAAFFAAAAAAMAVRVLHARYGVLHGSIWYGLTLFWAFSCAQVSEHKNARTELAHIFCAQWYVWRKKLLEFGRNGFPAGTLHAART